jgi:hypothetical protein
MVRTGPSPSPAVAPAAPSVAPVLDHVSPLEAEVEQDRVHARPRERPAPGGEGRLGEPRHGRAPCVADGGGHDEHAHGRARVQQPERARDRELRVDRDRDDGPPPAPEHDVHPLAAPSPSPPPSPSPYLEAVEAEAPPQRHEGAVQPLAVQVASVGDDLLAGGVHELQQLDQVHVLDRRVPHRRGGGRAA